MSKVFIVTLLKLNTTRFLFQSNTKYNVCTLKNMFPVTFLITENFRINSGSSGNKRKQEDSVSHNFKLRMNPHAIDFTKSPLSPIITSKRRILGEIQLPKSPLERLKSPMNSPKTSPFKSPLLERLDRSSPLSTRCKRSKISRVFEERTRFKMENKENDASMISETFIKLDVEEETRDFSFGARFESSREKVTNWTKLDFTDALQKQPEAELFVPQKEISPDDDCMLHDLEEEFEADNFDECTKYEIISTDSPDIISRGRASTRKVTARNFIFGAPLADNEQSTSFNKPNVSATRMLNFEESFEFTSPAVKKSHAAKKSLKFNETPTLRHEKSDSSIGSMSSMSPVPKTRLYSESTTSMESGFISELEEPFLEIEESNSPPKVENFNELLSGQIKNTIVSEKSFLRRPLNRSLSFNPESKARVSLFSILENPEKRSNKRVDSDEVDRVISKRRKNCESEPLRVPERRPVLQRAFSENNATIMTALARSAVEPDLIGDFSQPFALPLTSGHHSDLKSISCETLAALLRGEFEDVVSDFKVIDCRYPYEFEGGHVAGAVNYHTPAQVLALVSEPPPHAQPGKRSILVFHCEFSLERGPKLSRFLRSSDREKNKERYPRLHHPELYLLHEGYRGFHQQFPELCAPPGYTAMLDPRHRHLLKLHRAVPQPAASTGHRRHRLLF